MLDQDFDGVVLFKVSCVVIEGVGVIVILMLSSRNEETSENLNYLMIF